MKYIERSSGTEYDVTTSQDKLLADIYSSAFGRGIMKFLSAPIFSKCAQYVMNSRLSAAGIKKFAAENGICLDDYENKKFTSFNDFFTRKIKHGKRIVDMSENALVSPSDGKVSAYEIADSGIFVIKNTVYSAASLLRDKKLAKKYVGGTALIIRLSVDDYHRYIYCADGVKSHDRRINGFLQTVNPVVNKYYPVYKENSRQYCMIRTENFGDVIQMEVGALMVGKITNWCEDSGVPVRKGEEKGFFEFGGSTIVLFLEKGKANVCKDLIANTKRGFETKVKQGEMLACRNN